MRRRRIISGLLVSALGMAVQMLGQQTPAPCDPASSNSQNSSQKGSAPKKDGQSTSATESPCPSAKEPSAAEKFPFPGSSSAPSMPGTPQPEADAPQPGSGRPKSAAEEHPFPGSAPPMPGSEPSSSSSSADGYSSSSDGADSADTPKSEPAPDTSKTSGRRRLPKVEKLQSDEDRVDEDLRVAKFYENKGDLNAAYLRLRDAVKSLPNDSESHYALARLAQKLNKQDEAADEYSTYLKLEPDGQNVQNAQKALAQLQKK